MLTALCPPIHRENGVSSKKSPGWMEIPEGDLPFMRTKTMTFTKMRPCWNRRLGFPRFFSQIVVPPFFWHKTVVQRGVPSLRPRQDFFFSRSVDPFWMIIFLQKIGYHTWSQFLQGTGSRVAPFWDPENQFLSRNSLLKLNYFEWRSFIFWDIGANQLTFPTCEPQILT